MNNSNRDILLTLFKEQLYIIVLSGIFNLFSQILSNDHNLKIKVVKLVHTIPLMIMQITRVDLSLVIIVQICGLT